jgi:hypothetical protein
MSVAYICCLYVSTCMLCTYIWVCIRIYVFTYAYVYVCSWVGGLCVEEPICVCACLCVYLCVYVGEESMCT